MHPRFSLAPHASALVAEVARDAALVAAAVLAILVLLPGVLAAAAGIPGT